MNEAGAGYFTENYIDYERQSSSSKMRFYLRLVRRWAPPGGLLFELGVGLGVFLEQACAYYRCQGCDSNPHAVAAARKRAPRSSIREGSFRAVPDRPPPSAVVAWDVLEHVPELGEALDFIRLRLAPDGVLIAVVPVYDGPLGPLVRRLDHDPTHFWKWPRSRWLDTLREHGYDLVESGGIVRRLIASRWYLHLAWPQFLLRRWGSAFYFVARPAGK